MRVSVLLWQKVVIGASWSELTLEIDADHRYIFLYRYIFTTACDPDAMTVIPNNSTSTFAGKVDLY